MKKSKNLIVTDVVSFFSKGYNLKVHVQTVHEKERKFICQICKKGFGILKTLQKHSVLHRK